MLFEVDGDALHVGAGLLDGDARLQARDAVQPWVIAAILPAGVFRRLADRRPQLDAARELEVGRHDADHREAAVVERHLLIEDAGVAAEAPLPERVAEHGDRLRARLVFVIGEEAAPQGIDAQRLEQLSRHHAAGQPLGLARARQVVALAAVDADVLEDLVLRPPVLVVRVSDGHLINLRARLPQVDEPLGFGVGQRLEQHRIDDAEDGRRRADAERQRQHRDEGEAGVPEQHARAVAQVLQ